MVSMRLGRKKVLVLTVLALAVLFGGLAWSLRYKPGAGITRKNLLRVKVGMELAQVIAIFSDPPGDYSDGQWPDMDRVLAKNGGAERAWTEVKLWANDTLRILIYVGKDGRV